MFREDRKQPCILGYQVLIHRHAEIICLTVWHQICDYLDTHYTHEFQAWMGKAFVKNYGPTILEKKMLTSKVRLAFGRLPQAQLCNCFSLINHPHLCVCLSKLHHLQFLLFLFCFALFFLFFKKVFKEEWMWLNTAVCCSESNVNKRRARQAGKYCFSKGRKREEGF